MGFSRQECWSGLPFPSPGDLPDPGIKARSPAFQADAISGRCKGEIKNIPKNKWQQNVMTQNLSVQFSHSVMSDSLWHHGLQHIRPSCPPQAPRVHSNSCPSSHWCHPTISSSVVPLSSCLQSFPRSVSFPRSQFFIPGSQSIGVSASTSVLPMNIQDWFPSGLTVLTSLQ